MAILAIVCVLDGCATYWRMGALNCCRHHDTNMPCLPSHHTIQNLVTELHTHDYNLIIAENIAYIHHHS
jgi:hypothetical protein